MRAARSLVIGDGVMIVGGRSNIPVGLATEVCRLVPATILEPIHIDLHWAIGIVNGARIQTRVCRTYFTMIFDGTIFVAGPLIVSESIKMKVAVAQDLTVSVAVITSDGMPAITFMANSNLLGPGFCYWTGSFFNVQGVLEHD